jgi:hypothetical protein
VLPWWGSLGAGGGISWEVACGVAGPLLGHVAAYLTAARCLLGHRGLGTGETSALSASALAVGLAPLSLVRWGGAQDEGPSAAAGVARQVGAWGGAGGVWSWALLALLQGARG